MKALSLVTACPLAEWPPVTNGSWQLSKCKALISWPEDICLLLTTFLPSRSRPKWSPAPKCVSPLGYCYHLLSFLGLVLAPSLSSTSFHLIIPHSISLPTGSCSIWEVCWPQASPRWRGSSLELFRSTLSAFASFSVFTHRWDKEGQGPDARLPPTPRLFLKLLNLLFFPSQFPMLFSPALDRLWSSNQALSTWPEKMEPESIRNTIPWCTPDTLCPLQNRVHHEPSRVTRFA